MTLSITREVVEKADVLERAGNAQRGYLFRLAAADVDGLAVGGIENLAGRRFVNAGNAVEAGSLAGAVRAYQADDLARIDDE